MNSNRQPVSRVRLAEWLTERSGVRALAYSVPVHANSLPYILGGITFVGFLILFVTGIYLAQFYHPHPLDAHESVVFILTQAPLGDLVRSVHFWTAQLVTITALLHMLRVLFTGAYKRPRELNWYAGLGLLAVTLGLVFTGSVLKFDQEGIEALQHNLEAAEFLGTLGTWFSPELSRSVPLLTRLFNGHITILPMLFTLLIADHVFLIKQHGISPKVERQAISRPTAGEGTSPFTLHLQRMAGYGLLLLAISIGLSLAFPASLGQPGIPGAEVTKPLWMFLWLFPMEEAWGARALVVVPILIGVLLALLPILDRSPFMSPARRKPFLAVAGLILLAIVVSGASAALQPVSAHLE